MTGPNPKPALAERIARVLSANEAMAKVDAKTYRAVFARACTKRANALKKRIAADVPGQGVPVAAGQQGPNVPPGQFGPTAFQQERSKLVDRVLKHSAWDMIRAEDSSLKLAKAIEDLKQWEFIRVLAGGQDILGTAPELRKCVRGVVKVLGRHMAELADAISRAPDAAALDQFRVRVDNADNYVTQLGEVLRDAIRGANQAIDDEAWKAIAEKYGSTRADNAQSALKIVVGLVSLAIGIGKAAAPSGFGIAAAGAAGQAGVGMAEKKIAQEIRDADIKVLKKKYGPDFPYEKLNDNVTLMARRVAAKQTQNTKLILNALAIPGAEAPGWALIRNGLETCVVAYYNARVGRLAIALDLKKPLAKQITEFLKEDAEEATVDSVKEKCAEAAGEAIKKLGEKDKEKFAKEAGKVVGEAHKRGKEAAEKGAAESGAEAAKSAGEVIGELAKDIAVTTAENLAIKVFGYLLRKVLERLPISMGEVVSGLDLREMQDLLSTYNNAVQNAQTGLDGYENP